MGDTKKPKKTYARPRKPWDKSRLEGEAKVKEAYGLKNKREIRKMEGLVRKKRQSARKLLALTSDKREKPQKELLNSLTRIGLLGKDATVDDVLGLNVNEMLERRLETQVVRKGLANTMKQARQFITHGHIAIKGKKVSSPGYLVRKEEEDHLGYYGKPLKIEAPQPKGGMKKKFEEALPPEAAIVEGSVLEETPQPTEGEQ